MNSNHKCRDGSIEDRWSRKPEVSLMEVHGALSSLLYAANEELKGLGAICELSYRPGTYLELQVEIWGRADHARSIKNAQAVVDRLRHGILWGEYDYRFDMISHPQWEHVEPDYEPICVTAKVDLCHDRRELYASAA